jgi:CheY-like chemotaxis protein
MRHVNRGRVLVVDDEPAVRDLLLDALKGEGCDVSAAASGSEALCLARRDHPDVLVTDLVLGDCSGLEVIDRLRGDGERISAVVITGHKDPAAMVAASRRRPVELLTKPLDLPHLQEIVRGELFRLDRSRRLDRRHRRLRLLARDTNIERKQVTRHLQKTCAGLTAAYRALSNQFALQNVLLSYQRDLIGARNDDDVFATLFRTFVAQTGPLFGVAMVCNSSSQLRIIGRFGVPHPDSLRFCQLLGEPLVDAMLTQPQCLLMDAEAQADVFDASIRRYLIGVNVLAVPLMPTDGEMIGIAVFYRKGEQPFTDADVAMAEFVAQPTAMAIQRNE